MSHFASGSSDVPAIGIDVVLMTKRFGPLLALENVSLIVKPGQFHSLLGENGAGKSTLVKCIMGYYQPDHGSVFIKGKQQIISNPRNAHTFGIGMVYQHFTLVPNMSVAENLILARNDVSFKVDWAKERSRIDDFLNRMPFRIDVESEISRLSSGEKQKIEILKQLYLDRAFLILDEPTSVLTPDEADEILGMLRELCLKGQISILMITHKLREVKAFADEVTVLREGKLIGSGKVGELTANDMAEMMIGSKEIPHRSPRKLDKNHVPRMEIKDLWADDTTGLPAVRGLNLTVHTGEIVGIAGVSGNGQRELVETLAGQREVVDGSIVVGGRKYHASRNEMRREKVYCLPEEPLRNACVPKMTVAENLAMRIFDRPPFAVGGWWLNQSAMYRTACQAISEYKIKTLSPNVHIEELSGGNVQRVVLAREFASDAAVLIVTNPCFGLDIAAVAETRGRIMKARNNGVAVLLVSEDLDEILELSDRIVVMFNGNFVYDALVGDADVSVIGRCMVGQHSG